MKASDIQPQDRVIDTPDGSVFTRSWTPEDAGASPLIMLHDSLGCVALWRDFPARLAGATGRKVIAYDRLGFGQSEVLTDLPPLDFIAREAVTSFPAIAAAFGAERFALYGYSVGGEMAVEIAAAHPRSCEAVVTVSAQSFVEDRTLRGVHAAKAHYADPQQLERLRKYHGARAEWALRAWIDVWLDPAFANWTLDAALRQMSCPVLAIHGEDDEFGSVAFPKRIVENAAGPSDMLLLPGIGHVPHREAPERVLEAVAEFLGYND